MEEVPRPYRAMLGESLIHLGRPEHVTCTLDLMTGAGREAVIRKALELKGARSGLPGAGVHRHEHDPDRRGPAQGLRDPGGGPR